MRISILIGVLVSAIALCVIAEYVVLGYQHAVRFEQRVSAEQIAERHLLEAIDNNVSLTTLQSQ